jgi:sodium transport system permease protein
MSERVRNLIQQTRDDSRFHFEEVRIDDSARSLESGDLHFYIETIPELREGVPGVQLVFRGDRDSSRNGSDGMRDLLQRARRNEADASLRRRGFPAGAQDIFVLDPENTATSAQVTGSNVGRFLTVFLVMLMFTGGSIAAMDIIAGEKERGTLETLLTTAAGRAEIVASKQLAITSVALCITLIQAVNFLVYIQLRLIEMPEGFALVLPPVAIGYLLILFLPLAATVAAVLLFLSAYARTYKEAQLYFFPVYLLGLVPALAAVLPGIRLRSAIALVPVANVSVAAREILMGRPDVPMILVTFAVMTLTGLGLMRTSAKMLTQESIVVPAHLEAADLTGGPALFRKRVLRWFAVMWAIIFGVAAGIPQLATFRAQILFNEVVVFLGASILMIRVYDLNVRETLSLRNVNPAVWLAVLMAIPPAHIMGYACFRLANTIVPAPQQLLEQFSREFIPADLSLWQLYVFVAVLPAICEEIGFRGLLLHGLRRRFQPLALIVVVGLIFGIFHVSLFRIAPTAFMGITLTAVAVATGSILPGIVLHMGNNAFAVWASGNNAIPLDNLRWWDYCAATLVFLLAMWIVYRTRRADIALRF